MLFFSLSHRHSSGSGGRHHWISCEVFEITNRKDNKKQTDHSISASDFSVFFSLSLLSGHRTTTDGTGMRRIWMPPCFPTRLDSTTADRINDKIFETPKPRSVLGENNLYNVSISGSIPKEELESPTMIECYLTVPETNYTKKRSTIYYGKCQTSRKACYCKRFFSPPLFACFFRFCCSWCRRMLLRGYVTYAFLVVVYDGVFFGIVYL